MATERKFLRRMTGGLVSFMVAVGCFMAVAFADTLISARYLQPRGEHIIWEIEIPSPPPAAVIVTQYILPGSEILASSHPPSSYDQAGGVAKWLFSSTSPGTLRMKMTISKPIRKKGEIHGEVLFQDESQNTTASLFMRPAIASRKSLEGC